MYDQTGQYSHLDAARAALHVCGDNQLVNAFFSQRNVNTIHATIRSTIKEKYNLTIDRQSETELSLVMLGIYNLHQGNVVGQDIACQVRRLNAITVDWCVPNILNNIRHHIGYLRDSSRPYTLLDRPVNTSQKGETTLSWSR